MTQRLSSVKVASRAAGRLLALMFVMWLITGGLFAQQSTHRMVASADTWVRSTNPDRDTNYGSELTFSTRHSLSTYQQIAYLRFDLTDFTLPAGTVIDSVHLVMTMVYNQSTGGVVNILSVPDSEDGWDENLITWNTGRPDTVQGVAPLASVPVARLNPEVSASSGIPYQWDITSRFIDELNGGNQMLSLAIFPNYKTDVNVKFLSRESAEAELRPQLIVYMHEDDQNCFDLRAYSDSYRNRVLLDWKTLNNDNIDHFELQRGTDGENFTTLTNIATHVSTADTVAYSYSDQEPPVNQYYAYRVVTVLKDNSTDTSTVVRAGYGITGMLSRNIWIFDEVPSTQAVKARLMQSLDMSDFNPVGLRAEAGIPLVVNVERLAGADPAKLPTLIVGTYDRQSVTTYPLSEGVNTITNASGGDLYIRYSSDEPVPGSQVKITFQSGYQEMPLYIKGLTTHSQWLDQLAADEASPNVTMIANRVFIVTSREQALVYKDKNQDTLLHYMDEVMRIEDEISGLDGSSPVHEPAYQNKLMLLEKASGNPDATSLGRVRIPTGSINWILDPDYIGNPGGGWGVYHEIGHHHQQYPWSWSAMTETTVNIYSIACKLTIHPGTMGMASSDWDNAMKFLEDTSATKSYNNGANYVKLGLWNQLRLAFGDSFYHDLHKRTREERFVPGNDAAEIRLFMRYASEISGKDLTHFFHKWNITTDPLAFADIAALGLPEPETDISTLREDWKLTLSIDETASSLDSVVLDASAYGPESVKRVEFYADGVKIGESTTRPFRFVWHEVPAGAHTLVMKAVDQTDAVFESSPLTINQPAVVLTNPQDNASLIAGTAQEITALVAAGKEVSSVAFYANGALLGSVNQVPYTYSWTPAQEGTYELQAVVNYQEGGSEQSSTVGVIVGGYLPVADAYVRDGGSSNTNFGQEPSLVIKTDVGSYNRVSFLKFNPDAYTEPSDSLKFTLEILSTNSSVAQTQWQLWLCKDSDWQENTLTWNNKPSRDSLLGTIDTKRNGTVSWTIYGNIGDLVASDGTLSLAVYSTTVNPTSDASFHSREASDVALRPYLTVFGGSQDKNPLPVTYGPLQARQQGEHMLVNWQTFMESESGSFIIEHSTDGKTFKEVGSLALAGTATSGHHYQFVHAYPVKGVNYYRFKETGKSGMVQYSSVASGNFTGRLVDLECRIYPNPVRSGQQVTVVLPPAVTGDMTLRIFDASGRCRLSRTFKAGSARAQSVALPGMARGLYFVQLTAEAGTEGAGASGASAGGFKLLVE